jgi:hypothetical protein
MYGTSDVTKIAKEEGTLIQRILEKQVLALHELLNEYMVEGKFAW